MSLAWNVEASDEQLEELNLRMRRRLSELQTVATLTYQRQGVSEIARRLDCSRLKVIWLQQVLGRPGGLGRWPREPN